MRALCHFKIRTNSVSKFVRNALSGRNVNRTRTVHFTGRWEQKKREREEDAKSK
jgi:hypothetical protein